MSITYPITAIAGDTFQHSEDTYIYDGVAWLKKSTWGTGEVAPTTNLSFNGTYNELGGSGVVASSIGSTSSFVTGIDPFGNTSQFLKFNALSTDWVEFSKTVVSQKSSPLYLTGDFHLEFWARPDALPNIACIAWATDPTVEMQEDGTPIPIAISNSGGVTYIGVIHLGNNNTGTFAAVKNLDASDISTGDWFHVSFVRVNNLMSIYVNGIQEELYDGSPGAPWSFPKISPTTTTISNPQIIDQNFVSLGKGPGGFGVVDYDGCLAGFRLIDGKIESTAIPTAYHTGNSLVAGDLIAEGVIALSPINFDPMETPGYAKLYNRALAFSQPDILLLLNETSATDPIVNSGRLTTSGIASNLGTPVDCPLGAADWGKSAVFNGTSSAILIQPITGSSNIRFEDYYSRGDFTIDVRFRIASSVVGSEFVLLSSNINELSGATSASNVLDQYDFVLLIDGANNKVRFKQAGTPTEYAEFSWAPVADTDYVMSLNFHVDHNEFVSTGSGNDPVISGDGKLRIYVDGVPLLDAADASSKFVQLDEFTFIPEGNSGSGDVAPIRIGQYLDGSLAAPKWFAGQVHEYALYNNRCNHVGDGSYIVSPLPTRTTPRQVLTSIDNEGIGGTILTTESGDVLQNHVEGLRAGTLWNDDGTVKIVGGNPSSGTVHDAVQVFPKQTSDPAAVANSALLYAKEVSDNPNMKALYNFDNDDATDTSGPLNGTVLDGTVTGSPNGGGSQYVSSGIAGKAIHIQNANANSPSNYLALPDLGIGTSEFTFECFLIWGAQSAATVLSEDGDAFYFHIDQNYVKVQQGSDLVKWYIGSTSAYNFWHHMAIVRGPSISGNSQWNLFINGWKRVINTSSSGVGLIPTVDFSGNGYHIGRRATQSSNYAVTDIKFDSVRLSLASEYYDTSATGANSTPSPIQGSDYTIPSAFTPGAADTHLFGRASNGDIKQLT